MDLTAVKERLRAAVEARSDVLVEASHQIHEHPELNFEERFAHDLLSDLLAGEGLQVERQAHGLDTAFVARAGHTGPTIAILCEYDALPGIGHACGHNIIATAGLGAGLAAASIAEEVGGRVVVMGTPAEEGGGGKILMARRGAFDGVDAALMVHPAGFDLARMDVIAVQEVTATYRGAAAHAAAFPHKGRNALDGAVLGYLNVAALRQHIRPTERIHGIFTIGGDKPNIVPARAETHWMVRSSSILTLGPLKERVAACLEAGATASGCDVSLQWKPVVYADMLDNEVMVDLYKANSEALGRTLVEPDPKQAVVGSTDMGNISYVVPSIHPMIQAAPPGVPIHTPEFTGHARSETGDRAVVDGALAMAWTVADLWLADGVLDAVRAEFAATMAAVGPDARRSAIDGGVGA
ncbi:MAG: M20 family metallopeptidase [Acidimicrobiales bacterium]|nr:M20 family metallopeptidase [Acidimicrobiales bacterium]